MRLQLVIFALMSNVFAQRGANGNMARSGGALTGAAAPFGYSQMTPPNPGPLPSRPERTNDRSPVNGFYLADLDFDDSDHVLDGFYAGLAPKQAEPEVFVPLVVINENFRIEPIHPQLRDYSNVNLPEPGTVLFPPSKAPAPLTQPALQPIPDLADDEPLIFLIAFQDHVILPAIAYWVQGNMLHYVSLEGAPHQSRLELVDREFSKQLNRERHLPFALPSAK
jgi:hypothetical protein